MKLLSNITPNQSTRDQNEYPKKSFSHFLKYGENKENHVFTIDNPIALKKVHNSL